MEAMQQPIRKRCKKQSIMEDRISSLSDDIFISILSLLRVKEAGRTSVLSPRWRNLWMFTSNLSFDASDLGIFVHRRRFKGSIKAERTRFCHLVNQVLKFHKGQTLEEFRICFDVDDKSLLDSWINFALERGVKILELDLLSYNPSGRAGYYTFPVQFLHNCNLRELCLSRVDLNPEAIMHIFSSCPFLESLSLTAVESLEHLRIPEQALKLKCLKFESCLNLKDIEISAINLFSFIYHGPIITLSVPEVPFLVEASFGGYFALSLLKNFPPRSRLLSQLQSLSLKLILYPKELQRLPKLPKFRNMRQLELIVAAGHRYSLLHFMAFLEACPVLRRFALKMTISKDTRGVKASAKWKTELVKAKRRHKCLEVVELVGFIGCKVDVEVAQYVLKNTRALKKIIIDPSSPFEKKYRVDNLIDPDWKQVARQCAKQLDAILPLGVELVIL